MSADPLDAFADEVRAWCATSVPTDWRHTQSDVDDDGFVAFQHDWFDKLRAAGWAVPHWPVEWGGGMSTDRQRVLYSELARADAPRLVLAFVAIHHVAATLLAAGTDAQRARHLPAILDGEIWCQGFSEPGAGSDLASLRTSAVRRGDDYVVSGQKLWASGARHAQWCLALVRTDRDAPKRHGISCLLIDLSAPGIEIRPIRQATGDEHFCEIFFDEVAVPAANLVGAENQGWQVAQATLTAERGMTMLELAERLWHGGFARLVAELARPDEMGRVPIDDPVVADHLAGFEVELTALRRMCRDLIDRHELGRVGPADASIVKLAYSELLQRLMNFASEARGCDGLSDLVRPRSSGWESGAWGLDFVASWEWTIPGGSSEIQRTIIAERGLGLPREPQW